MNDDHDPRPLGRMGGYTAFEIGDELHLLPDELALGPGKMMVDAGSLSERLARVTITGRCECGAQTRHSHTAGGMEVLEITHTADCPLDQAVHDMLGRRSDGPVV